MADALSHFIETYERGESQLAGSFTVLELFNNAQKEKGKPLFNYNTLHEASDMGRFGIVLSVASMDDFFTRKYAEVMIKAIKKHGVNKGFTEMLESAGLDVAGALELISMDRPYRRIRTIAQDYYRNYTTQTTVKIDDLFKTIGISNLSNHAQNRSKRKTLISSVTELVKRRHKIVHSGDLTRTGKLQKIDQKTVNRIEDIKIFVNCANDHIDNYVKQRKK